MRSKAQVWINIFILTYRLVTVYLWQQINNYNIQWTQNHEPLYL